MSSGHQMEYKAQEWFRIQLVRYFREYVYLEDLRKL